MRGRALSDELLRELLAAVREQTDVERQVLEALKKRRALGAANSELSTKRLISKREAARRLGKNVDDFYAELIKTRILPVVLCGKVEKVRADDVERLVAEGWTPPVAAPARGRKAARSAGTRAAPDGRTEAEKIEAMEF